MINLFKNIDPIFLSLAIIALFPIFPMSIISISILIFVAVSLLVNVLKRSRTPTSKYEQRWFLTTTAFYLWIIIAIFYSSDTLNGIKRLQSSISLLVLPLIVFFFIRNVSVKYFDIINKSFVIANFLLALFIHYHLFSEGAYENFKGMTYWDAPIREALANNNFKDLHPTYVSLWFLYSALFLLDFLMSKSRKRWYKILMIFALIFFLLTAILLSSRITFIAFLAACIVYFTFQVRNTFKKLAIISAIAIGATTAILNISYLKSRLIDEFKATELQPPVGDLHNSINIRVGIYQCSYDLLKSNWLLGVGYGNVQYKLNQCFKKFDTDVYTKTNYNSHNQYLHIFIASGILGIVLFVIMLIEQLRLALRNKDYLYLSFLVLVFITFISENILVRIHGVLFYALFNTLFIKKWTQPQRN